jgi:hypothetical protein
VSLVKDLRRDPIVLRGNYAHLAIEQAVVDGITRHGDDFVIVVERTPKPPSDAAAATAKTSPESPGLEGGQPSLTPNGNFVVPQQSQPTVDAVPGPTAPRP